VVQTVTATLPVAAGATATDAGAARFWGREVFLQMHGRYTVRGVVGGWRLALAAQGFAETFVPLPR
jgi:hypothetical protein